MMVGVQPVLPVDGGTHWLQFILSDLERQQEIWLLVLYMFFLCVDIELKKRFFTGG